MLTDLPNPVKEEPNLPDMERLTVNPTREDPPKASEEDVREERDASEDPAREERDVSEELLNQEDPPKVSEKDAREERDVSENPVREERDALEELPDQEDVESVLVRSTREPALSLPHALVDLEEARTARLD
jgi:hypothetical protein